MKDFNPGLRKLWQWHPMPIAVFLFGILSIVLFLWIERIDEKLHNNHNIVDTIRDIQISTATFHIRLEESLNGYSSIDSKKIFEPLDQAIKLADVTIIEGETGHESISGPPRVWHLRDSAVAIKALLIQFKEYGLERIQNREKAEIGMVRENKFETAFKEILSKSSELENILDKDEARDRNKSRRLFFTILFIWAAIVAAATSCLGNSEKERKKAEENLLKSNEQLLSSAVELTQHREQLSALVDKRTAELTAANKLLTEEIDEHKRTEKVLRETEAQVREISTQLLEAQEIERRRISMELHDELGQALNVMKLQMRFIEKRLDKDQIEIKRECEELLTYTDRLIEDVRRLSRDLSPIVLEDIGLTASLQWLISNLAKNPDMKVTSDISEIDDLIAAKNRIVIYRVIQEVLTNIVKHAQAENVSFVIDRRDNKVIFSIKDDGKGFDLQSILMKDISEKGFGLRTMNERVKTIGGVFDVWSQKGMGTLIMFGVPGINKEQETEMGNRE
jgi:signal transduction histidine kinase